jgi:hypothetical protein
MEVFGRTLFRLNIAALSRIPSGVEMMVKVLHRYVELSFRVARVSDYFRYGAAEIFVRLAKIVQNVITIQGKLPSRPTSI